MLTPSLLTIWLLQLSDIHLTSASQINVPEIKTHPPIRLDVPPELNLDPLPEYYTAKPEKKIISKFWDVLQKRRMAALVLCEKKLWEESNPPVVEVLEVVNLDSTMVEEETAPAKAARAVAPPPPPPPRAPAPPTDGNAPAIPVLYAPVQAVEYPVPVYEGRAFVKDIEVSLDNCYHELRSLSEIRDPVKEQRDDLIRELGLVTDQIEACKAAGGQAPSVDGTTAALERVKKLSVQTADMKEVINALESSVVRLMMDKRACFDTLELSGNLHIYLEYVDVPDSENEV